MGLRLYNNGFTIGNITVGGSLQTGIGIVTAPDGEHIGISNGTFAFDTGRADGNLKNQASAALKAGNITSAESYWRQAVTEDTSDAESLIYLENQRVLASGKPYITFVIGTMLTGNDSNISTGRDNLQGAYVAQKEYNDGAKLGKVQVYLLIASAGSKSDYATSVAKQIVQAAQHDGHIVGVMGWPYSSYVASSFNIFANAHIPIVSPTASSDTLSGISPYFFRVAPPNNTQAVAGAKYAEQQLHATQAVVFVDNKDTYSKSLADDFTKQFTSDGNKIVATESYIEGQTDQLASLLQQALNATPTPNLIYFSGYSSDLSVLLTDLKASQSNIELLGGDGLYQLGGYESSARPNFEHLHFTAFAYPDEWGYRKQKNPNFFTIYAYDFDPSGSKPGSYGYERPDNDAILSYDATYTLLQASKNALGNGSSFAPSVLKTNLADITGSNALQGVSGRISFVNGEPDKKAIVVLSVDSAGHIQLINGSIGAIQGCFLLSDCSS